MFTFVLMFFCFVCKHLEKFGYISHLCFQSVIFQKVSNTEWRWNVFKPISHQCSVQVQFSISLSVFIIIQGICLSSSLLPHFGFLLMLSAVQTAALVHTGAPHYFTVNASHTKKRGQTPFFYIITVNCILRSQLPWLLLQVSKALISSTVFFTKYVSIYSQSCQKKKLFCCVSK